MSGFGHHHHPFSTVDRMTDLDTCHFILPSTSFNKSIFGTYLGLKKIILSVFSRLYMFNYRICLFIMKVYVF